MDAGWGLAAGRRDRRGGAGGGARASKPAGAIVEADAALHHARDGRRHRPLLAPALVDRHLGAAARAPAPRCCPTSASGPRRAPACTADRGLPRLQPVRGPARRRGRRLPAVRLRALAGGAGVGLPRRMGQPAPTTRSAPMEHIAFTLPYNMSEQPAISIHCGHTEGGLPIGLQIIGRRHDDLGVLRLARAWEALRPAAAALAVAALSRPRGHGRERATFRSMSQPISAATPPAAPARRRATAAEQALWRMMSFYDTPLADLDAAIAADPGWAMPHVMKAGFLLSLTEPALLREADAHLPHARALAKDGAPRVNAPTSKPCSWCSTAAGSRLPGLGRAAAAVPARRAGAAVGAAVGLLPRRRRRPAPAPGARAARVGRGRPAVRLRAGAARLRPGGEQPLPAGRRGGPPRAGRPTRACPGPCTRWPT